MANVHPCPHCGTTLGPGDRPVFDVLEMILAVEDKIDRLADEVVNVSSQMDGVKKLCEQMRQTIQDR